MTNISLSSFTTRAPDGYNKGETKKKTRKIAQEIGRLQELLYAESKKAILIVFQGMDSSGKDGATANVFKYCSPSCVKAYPFKKPTEEEFDHDFLWRVHKLAPAQGQMTIFNRSHYEDILIQRVHGWIDEKKVNMRIDAINTFERLLVEDNTTTILKFYMHISKARQKEKLQERIDEPRKNWKHNENDWKEREHWDEYMRCYEDVINRCNTVPWIIAPVDSRSYRDYFIASKILEVMQAMTFDLPVLSEDQVYPR